MQLPNILNMALGLVGRQYFDFYAFIDRSENAIGYDVARYANPQTICGQIQAVQRNLYSVYGLDLQKNYITIYLSQDAFNVARDISGDQIIFAGDKYQCLSNVPWFKINGWVSILAVQIPND